MEVVISVSAVGRTPNPHQHVSSRLDPEEALSGPMYVVAIALILLPTLDFVFSVPPAQFSSVQWRFAAFGMLSEVVMMPVIGVALAVAVAGFLRHFHVVRLLVFLCLTLALLLIVASLGFVLDVLQLQGTVPQEGRPAFNSAWIRALSKLALLALILAYLGWRARRTIPARARHRTPKTVHVVSK
jgi:hypothetical protein